MEKIIIRKGLSSDIPDALRLIKELALFEKAPEAVSNTEAMMIEDGFGKNPCYQFFVAELKKEIVGIAVYFIKYSTWKGKGIYLDDLIVTEQHRKKGIGKLLFEVVVEEAKAVEAKQVHWQVLDWNTPAIGFYKKYDAEIDASWLDCKLNETQIKNFGRG